MENFMRIGVTHMGVFRNRTDQWVVRPYRVPRDMPFGMFAAQALDLLSTEVPGVDRQVGFLIKLVSNIPEEDPIRYGIQLYCRPEDNKNLQGVLVTVCHPHYAKDPETTRAILYYNWEIFTRRRPLPRKVAPKKEEVKHHEG